MAEAEGREGGQLSKGSGAHAVEAQLGHLPTFHAKLPESHPTPSSGTVIAAQSPTLDWPFHGAQGHSQSQALIFYSLYNSLQTIADRTSQKHFSSILPFLLDPPMEPGPPCGQLVSSLLGSCNNPVSVSVLNSDLHSARSYSEGHRMGGRNTQLSHPLHQTMELLWLLCLQQDYTL